MATKKLAVPKKALLLLGLLLVSLVALYLLMARTNNHLPKDATNKVTDDVLVEVDARLQALNAITPSENSPAAELKEFANWLVDNDVQGFIGEAGWPASSKRQAQSLVWLDIVEAGNMDYTVWAAGSKWPVDYKLKFFENTVGGSPLDVTTAQGKLVTKHSSTNIVNWGVNVSGLEFGASREDFNNSAPGLLGENYFKEPDESFVYLASQGVSIIRLPFSWERLQPEPYGQLNQEYLALITDTVNAAGANGIKTVLDLHNYAKYKTAGKKLVLGSNALPFSSMNDIWLKLHAEFENNQHVYAYGLMNEPQGIPRGSQTSSAKNWELATQDTLTLLREAGYNGKLFVPGYEWSKVQNWSTHHPTSWITDPLDNYAYEAHHYWDVGQYGTYENE